MLKAFFCLSDIERHPESRVSVSRNPLIIGSDCAKVLQAKGFSAVHMMP
jgi:hypothetical protein